MSRPPIHRRRAFSALGAASLLACSGSCSSASSSSASSTVDGGTSSSSATCSNTVEASALAATHVQALGTHAVGEKLTFTVPGDTVSISIIEQLAGTAPVSIDVATNGTTTAYDNVAVPLRLVDPSGRVVYDDLSGAPADGSGDLAFFASDAPWTGTFTLPNTTAALALGPLPAGAWTVIVSDYAYECLSYADCSGGSSASQYDVTVLTKTTADGSRPSTGVVDVAFYFAATVADGPAGQPALALSAATAAAGGDQDIDRMVSTLGVLLARAGLTLGSVSYHDLASDVLAEYAAGVYVDATGPCDALRQLFTHAAAGNALPVFFASSFTSDSSSGGTVVGIDGTVPGPASFGGTIASGVAVATSDLRHGRAACAGAPAFLACGADLTAYIVAHEAGHFLGLYHVTEQDGLAFDPLSDTPTCPCSTCKSRSTDVCSTGSTGHLMSVTGCTASASCGGGDNLMFWVIDNGSTGSLTAEQQAVMRANPLVQ